MRIEIVCDQDNLLGMGVEDIRRVLEHLGEIYSCPGCGDDGFTLARKWFKDHKDFVNTVTLVFRVYFFRLTRRTGNSGFFDQLLIGFIDANNRMHRIIGTLIDIQYILHFGYKFCTGFWNAPFLDEPWFDLVFFITSQTVLSVIYSTTSSRISSSAMACIVQRERPSGGSEQAMAQILASISPVTLR
ncbi:hypothetical protein D3C72_1676880 [compost metagenome]